MSINTRKHIGELSDQEAFKSWDARNFYRAYCRTVGNDYNRELFTQGAAVEAHGKYEPFVMPAIERAIEAIIARQIIGMNMLYPPGNFSLLNEKFRKSELDKARNPIHWGYARMPFRTMSRHGPDSFYVKKYTLWNKKMTYTSYTYAPIRFLSHCHAVIKNQADMEKVEKGRIKWDRKPWHERIEHSELTFLLALISACAHENLTFLNEIRNGEHTYMGYIPKISESDLAALRE